ncbi:hypothetical protein [Nocardia asiatica]|uniref:hypothetical protein n=1 Tax=Nocardia asiatica TaxID=209252 RepID=UPI0024545F00|nr:hypothetical protein [Nocardia asiatica]
MSDNEYRLPEPDPPARLHAVAARAAHAGYQLLRGSSTPYTWELVDAEDGAPILFTSDLDHIEQWLDS